MSLSATRIKSAKRSIVDRACSSDSVLEIREYLEGCYDFQLPENLSQEQIDRRSLKRWMKNRIDVMRAIGLTSVTHKWDGAEEEIIFTRSLEAIGVTTPRLGNRFLDFYLGAYDPSRSWVSGCQIDQKRAFAIGCTPNYNKLPDWVRKGLLNAPKSAQIGGDRIGDIWRLPACVKAWKWCAGMPKNIAEKVGKMKPLSRMIAAWAWLNAESVGRYNGEHRSEISSTFWELLNNLQKATLVDQIDWFFDNGVYRLSWTKSQWNAFLGESLGLPWGFIKLDPENGWVSRNTLIDAVVAHGSPTQACSALFGISGPATVKAFQASDRTRWEWARAIGDGNADAVQKILTLSECIKFQSESIEFLMSLPMQSRIRLLQTTKFKYRGIENEITDDHIRDTGYLWKNIQKRPELGRVRCWFSVHEQLASAFVKELPDEALPIPHGWGSLDGLCSVDGSWELEFPKRVATLKYYGEALRNCVGGYGPAIKQGRSVIFMVREHGMLTHCVEIANQSVRQFYRSGNRSSDPTIERSVCTALQQAGVL
jgi:hypothetical protein